MKKENKFKGLIALGAMTVVSVGLIFGMRSLTGEKKAKTQALDIAGYTSEDATIQSAGRIVGSEDATKGYVVTVSSAGYNAANPIVMDITFDATGKTMTAFEVKENQETTGLGSKVSEEPFINQFNGMTAPVYAGDMEANGTELEAVSGATVSSMAVARAINTACDYLSTVAQ